MSRAVLTTALAVAILAGSALAAGLGKRLDQESSFGEFAAVAVDGQRADPRSFTARFTSDPPGQIVEGQTSISCRDKRFDTDRRSRPFTITAPATVRIALTMRRPVKCFAAAFGSFDYNPDSPPSGRLTATLFGKRR